MHPINQRLITSVMKHEGTYDSINRNTDGAGLSAGIFQWPQRTGGLSTVLDAYYQANPGLFIRIFGPGWKGLLEHARSRSLEPLEGALLWQDPWASRFILAGQQVDFQQAQDRLAENGPFLKAAYKGATALGFTTERSLSVVLDAAVSQGPEFAVKVARSVRKAYAGTVVPMRTLLEAYLTRSAAHFRSAVEPTPTKIEGLSWRKVGNEWHKFAGSIDLYLNVTRRRKGFLNDQLISDALLNPPDTQYA